MAGSHGLMNKGAYMYDEIYRIPLLVKAPGTPQPRRSGAFVHLMDVTATCLALDGWGQTGEHDGARSARRVTASPRAGNR